MSDRTSRWYITTCRDGLPKWVTGQTDGILQHTEMVYPNEWQDKQMVYYNKQRWSTQMSDRTNRWYITTCRDGLLPKWVRGQTDGILQHTEMVYPNKWQDKQMVYYNMQRWSSTQMSDRTNRWYITTCRDGLPKWVTGQTDGILQHTEMIYPNEWQDKQMVYYNMQRWSSQMSERTNRWYIITCRDGLLTKWVTGQTDGILQHAEMVYPNELRS